MRIFNLRALSLLFVFVLGWTALCQKSLAFEISHVTSSQGLEAWLVESHETPIISFAFAWEGGARHDPAGREGLAHLIAQLLHEGAGDMDAETFQSAMEDISTRITFSAERDALFATMQTLSPNREAALRLLRRALSAPRFDEDAVQRVKRAAILEALRRKENIRASAARAFRKAAFGAHPYANHVKGNEESLARITREDIKNHQKKLLHRKNLHIAVSGDITPQELADLLDELSQDLPASHASLISQDRPASFSWQSQIIKLARSESQSVIFFGSEGLVRRDRDFLAAAVLNHILGGDGESRLMRRVRSDAGLAYDVSTYLVTRTLGGVFLGSTETRRAQTDRVLRLIRDEMERLRAEGPQSQELALAKSYLINSYHLFFDSSIDVARGALSIKRAGLGRDYLKKRESLIENISAEDVRRVAQRLLRPQEMLVVIAGGEASP